MKNIREYTQKHIILFYLRKMVGKDWTKGFLNPKVLTLHFLIKKGE